MSAKKQARKAINKAIKALAKAEGHMSDAMDELYDPGFDNPKLDKKYDRVAYTQSAIYDLKGLLEVLV